MAPAPRELYFALEFHILRTGKNASQQYDADHQPAMSDAKHDQNNIPMARLS